MLLDIDGLIERARDGAVVGFTVATTPDFLPAPSFLLSAGEPLSLEGDTLTLGAGGFAAEGGVLVAEADARGWDWGGVCRGAGDVDGFFTAAVFEAGFDFFDFCPPEDRTGAGSLWVA